MNIILGDNATISYLLIDTAGQPLLDLNYTDIVCQYIKNSGISILSKTLTSGNFSEAGSGIYDITFTYPEELDTIGPLVSLLYEKTNRVNTFDISCVTASATGSTCTLYGTLTDLQGIPMADTELIFENKLDPLYNQGLGVIGQNIKTRTNIAGEVLVALLKNSKVRVSIANINFTRDITVPNSATGNLIVLMQNASDEFEVN